MPTYGQRSDTQSQVDEHITDSAGLSAKKTLVLGRDSSNLFQDLLVDSDGRIQVAGIVPEKYDEIDADSMTRPTSVVFKNGGVTVATLTMTYTGTAVNIVRT